MPTPRRSQADRSRSTRATLVETARALFAERGYANVPADEIVSAAGVTRGALYHHFADKKALFLAVFEDLEAELNAEFKAAAEAAPDQWAGAVTALSRFLDACQRPEVVRIALTDAPAVLGWQGWREVESRHGLGLITEQLDAAIEAGLIVEAPVPALAQVVLSAVIEAALMIAHAEDQALARTEAEQALLVLLSGLLKR
ncbi:MAG: TetR family transcriptional regulator [Actinophytocola sp.]|nr:TetR family transcriptional regulator [Actinophytocola sp.]